MAVVGFKAVGVAQNHKITISAGVVFGISHLALKRRIDRLTRNKTDVDTLVHTPTAWAVARRYPAEHGCGVVIERADKLHLHTFGNVANLHILIGKNIIHNPMLAIDFLIGECFIVRNPIAPSIICIGNDFRLGIVCIDCINGPFGQIFEGIFTLCRGRRCRQEHHCHNQTQQTPKSPHYSSFLIISAASHNCA